MSTRTLPERFGLMRQCQHGEIFVAESELFVTTRDTEFLFPHFGPGLPDRRPVATVVLSYSFEYLPI